MQFKLTKKVAISAFVCLVLIAIAAVIVFSSNLAMRTTVRLLSEETARQVAVNGQINYQLAKAIAYAQVFYYTRKDADRLEAQRLFRAVQESQATLESLGRSPEIIGPTLASEHAAILERRKLLLARAQEEFLALVTANEVENDVLARRAMVALVQSDRESVQMTEEMGEILDREAIATSAGIDQLIWRGLSAVGLAFGLITLLIPLILVLLHYKIVQPIKYLSAAFERVASGNLAQSVAITSSDEIGDLQQGFNQMVTNLEDQREQLTQNKDLLETRAVELEQTLAELQRSLNEREQLSNTIRELASPVLPVLDGVLIMPLIGVIDTQRVALFMDALLKTTMRHNAHSVILDVTGVPIIDTQVARALLQSAEALRLLGAKPIIAGIRPELAQTIVGLGLDLSSIIALADLQSSVEYIINNQSSSASR